jgi:hypothetical protein
VNAAETTDIRKVKTLSTIISIPANMQQQRA